MNRVKATASVGFASRDLAPASGTPQYFTEGVPGTRPATVLPGYFMNMTMDELLAIVTAGGLAPDDANWNQVWQALLRSVTFHDIGSVNHLVIQLPAGLSFPAGALGFGTTFQVQAAADCTGPVDFAPFGLAALPVIHLDTSAPCDRGDIMVGAIYTLTHNGAGAWQLRTLNPSTIIQAAALYKPTIVIKSTPGAWTWTVPNGVQRVRFRLWGGGGGGGGVFDPGGASGGGGGGYGEVTLATVAGITFSGTIGAGGAAGTPGSDGGTGGTTSLQTGGGYSAFGGVGGNSANTTAENSVAGGGVSGAFEYTHGGQPSYGGMAGYRAGPAVLYYAGAGGVAQNGGFGGGAGTGPGNPGGTPGGGGAGSASSGGSPGSINGGAGGAGQVEISY